MPTIDGQNGLIQPYTFFLLSPRQLELLAWYARVHAFIRDLHTHIYLAVILTRDGDLRRNWRSSFSAYPQLSLARAIVTHRFSQAAKGVRASQDALVDIFERIESFFRRLEVYIEVTPTAEMMDTIIKIMVEVLSILGIAMKEIKQGWLSE
jgi:hypothetical protein